MAQQDTTNKIRSERGFSLVEVLVSMGIVLVVTGTTAPSFLQYLNYNLSSTQKMGALDAAQQILDSIRVVDPASLPSSGSDSPVTVTVDNRSYQVTISYCTNSSYCTSTSRHIKAEIAYNGDYVYSTETVYTQLR